MTIQVVSQPAYEPVALADAKQWMSIDTDDVNNDALVTLLIKAMREYAENLTNRAFIQRTLRLYLDQWPVRPGYYGLKIELPFPPLVTVSSVKYRDLNGTLQTLDPTLYVVHDWREPAIIVPEWNVIWPVIRRVPDAVQINYTAGYPTGSPGTSESDAQANMPASLRLWMQARAATLFQNREQLVVGNVVSIPRDFADALLDSLVIGTRMFPS